MKLSQEEMQAVVADVTKSILSDPTLTSALRKIDVSGGQGGDVDPSKMSKEEKLAKWFKAKMTGDMATLKALTGGAGSGEDLLPIEFQADIIDRVVKDPIALRNQVTIVPVTLRSGWFPVGATGITMAWEANDGAFGNNQSPTFDQMPYKVNRLSGYTAVSRDLINDTPINIYNYLLDQYAIAFVKAENKAIIAGPGTTAPTGIIVDANVKTQAVKTAGKLSSDDVVSLPYAVDVTYREGAVYIADSIAVKAMRLMKDGQGRYLFVDGDLTKGTPTTFNGYKLIEFTDAIPQNLGAGANETNIIFGNLKNYYLFDRKEMGAELNTQSDTAFTNHQVLVKMWERIDGGVAVPKAFVKLTGVPTA